MFFTEFLKNPGSVGAIKPSSIFLAREMVKQAGIAKAETIVELGPGTGAFTGLIDETRKESSNFFALEINQNMINILSEKLPEVEVINDSVENLTEILKGKEIEKVDSIVCGLPWAAFNPELQDTLLGTILDSMPVGGRFCTFAYLQGVLLPAGQRFSKKLKANFSTVTKSRTVWRNTPPAFIYNCVK